MSGEMPRTCFFDLETTGTDPAEDKIVEITLLLYTPQWGAEKPYRAMRGKVVDPEREIPESAAEVHGITTDDVRSAPPFRRVAGEVQSIVTDALLVTYNGRRFDVPILQRELKAAGFAGLETDEETGLISQPEIDLYRVWAHCESRNLATAVERFTDGTLEDAHSSEADAAALPDLLRGMADEFDLWRAESVPDADDPMAWEWSLRRTMEGMAEITAPENAVDRYGKLELDEEGRICWAFGEHRGEPVAEHGERGGYAEWVVHDADDPPFPEEVRAIVAAEAGV